MKKAIITILAVLTVIVTTMAPASTMKAEAATADQTMTMNARLLADINNLRAEQGLPALTLDNELNSFAAVRLSLIHISSLPLPMPPR